MNSVTKNYLLDILLMVFSIAPVIVSLLFDIKINETHFCWFQRSGSLMALFAILLEINSSNYSGIKGSCDTLVNGEPAMKVDNIPIFKKVTKVFGYILAILGTIIWGYGDLLPQIL